MLDIEEISFGHRDPTSHKYYVSVVAVSCGEQMPFSVINTRKIVLDVRTHTPRANGLVRSIALFSRPVNNGQLTAVAAVYAVGDRRWRVGATPGAVGDPPAAYGRRRIAPTAVARLSLGVAAPVRGATAAAVPVSRRQGG